MKQTNRIVLYLAVSAFCAGPAFSQSRPAAFIDTVPAKGSRTMTVPVKTWGRYSVRAGGDQPVALSIADKRSGTIRRDGTPGERNARIDLFLDIGEYRITTQGEKGAKGISIVSLLPFAYAPESKPFRLIPMKENRLELRDLQQHVFWFEADRDTTIYIEACGRYLEDVRLWRDGEWLVESQCDAFTARPKPETPLNGIILSTRVPKGTYMVAAYGGNGKDWAVKSNGAPLYLQGFLETLDANCVRTMTIPPKGYVRMRLSGSVSTVVAEEPERKPLYMEISGGGSDSIFAKSATPRMMLSCGGGSQQTITISGTPGQPFTIQTMGTSSGIPCEESGSWWVSSVHTGNYKDQLGASGAVIGSHGAIVAVCADTISSGKEIAKRFNFLADGEMTAYVWVETDGTYWVSCGGVEYNWRLKRYFWNHPPDYKEPPLYQTSGSIDCNRGLHILELSPRKKGIASVVIQKTSAVGSVFRAGKEMLSGPDDSREWMKPRPCVQFPSVTSSRENRVSLLLNNQAPELSALQARRLPLDPDEPLAIWCSGDEKVRIPLHLSGKRVVSLSDARGAPAPFEINGRRYDKPAVFEPGDDTVIVTAGSKEYRRLFLKAITPERVNSEPPPPFPDEKLTSRPAFPALVAGETAFLDLGRESARPYAIVITEPGIYRIETEGRLATRLMLRDRFLNFVRTAHMNGIGRNAMLIEYLLTGSYQVEAGTVGGSAGRLGLAAYRNPLAGGGALEPGIDNRNFIPAYSGVSYDVAVAEAGTYRVATVGQGGDVPFRFEDKHGWPFDPAESSGPLDVALRGGAYRLIGKPVAQDGRRIARLTMSAGQREVKGRGPHALDINAPLSLVWVERKDKKEQPAEFTFTAPAPISATILTTDGFTATLYRRGNDSALDSWNGKKSMDLDMGDYRLCVSPRRPRNYAPFQVSVTTRDLVAGLSYTLGKSKMLRVSVGVAGVAEIGSQGMLDANAKLYDSDAKTVIVENDDGFLDWNFAILRALKPGRYFLRVESAEGAFTSTTVFMRLLADTLMDTLACRDAGRVVVKYDLKRRLAVFPLSAADSGDVLACAAKGRSRIGIAIDKKVGGGGAWAPIAQTSGESPLLSVPRDRGSPYRLKVWSEGTSDETFEVTYIAAAAKRASWDDARDGLGGQAQAIGAGHCAWFKLDLGDNAPGHFRSAAQRNQLTGVGASATVDSLFVDESPAWFSAARRNVWVELRFESPGGFRVKLDPMTLDKECSFTMPLAGGRPRVFTTDVQSGVLGFLSLTSDGRYPLAAVAAAPSCTSLLRLRGIPVRPEMWIGDGVSATVTLAPDPRRVAVWNALPSNDGTQPPVTISWNGLPIEDGGTLTDGVASWTASRPSARVLHYNGRGAPIRVRLTLPPSTAAMMTRSDGSRDIECSLGDKVEVCEFCTDGGDLYLIALKGGARFDRSAFIGQPGDAAMRPLAAGKSRQMRMQREGTVLVPVASDVKRESRLFWRGAVNGVGWVGQNGMLRHDLYDGAPVGPGGFLCINAGEGWIKLDLCDESAKGGVMACKWGAPLAPPKGAAAVPLDRSSVVKLGDGENWFTFTLSDTQHVNFGAALPLAAILLRDGTPVNYQEAWEQFNWDLPLPPGSYLLGIHPSIGSSIQGGRLTALWRPIERLSEKNPFSGYLAPGEGRLLSFVVAKKDRFGIGLRMTRETAQARLYDARGAIVETGKQQFVDLTSGTYYLWVRVPASGEGTDVTAFLFGQEPPPNEPPARLVQWITGGAQGPRPDASITGPGDDDGDDRPQWMRQRGPRLDATSGEQTEEQTETGDTEQSYEESEGEGEGEGERREESEEHYEGE